MNARLRRLLPVAAVYATIVKVDTQDNIIKSLGVGEGHDWVQNVNLDTGEFLNNYGAKRTSAGIEIYVSSTTPRRKKLKVRMLNFPYRHKVKRVSTTKFLVTSPKLQEYFDHTDMIYFKVEEKGFQIR